MRGIKLLSLGAAALAAVALVPVDASAGRGHGGWHGAMAGTVVIGAAVAVGMAVAIGTAAIGAVVGAGADGAGVGGPRVYAGPRRCWSARFGWVPCRRWYW